LINCGDLNFFASNWGKFNFLLASNVRPWSTEDKVIGDCQRIWIRMKALAALGARGLLLLRHEEIRGLSGMSRKGAFIT
jgi:hypothetical protein